MTDLNPTLNAEDIVDDIDTGRDETLDAEGDRWMVDGERRAFAREQGLRQALRSDLDTGRSWARDRATLARARIEEEPMKATLYALGAGVLIGILLRR
ncbi:hypothetical protein [Brevundimonas aurifodinae]|uniref:DUF883 domain-containing protein n=2 Tax=Brevundimonas TaxID=41275 RepID=A0ABV1NP03_9CAUL|nr:MAG: hypothetical protein B7Z42_11930 [Brevundimonas sp. 12-68-7]OYX34430.1 MAG: hypothetical protein B7Z01_06200 [Brevundimonas subvibrioides]